MTDKDQDPNVGICDSHPGMVHLFAPFACRNGRRSLPPLNSLREPRLTQVQRIVDEQAEDEGLWCQAANIVEAYLQQELRRLHAAIENDASAPVEPLDRTSPPIQGEGACPTNHTSMHLTPDPNVGPKRIPWCELYPFCPDCGQPLSSPVKEG